MKRLLLPLAAVAIAGLLLPAVRPAYACGCLPQTRAERVQQADAIAVGRVSGLQEQDGLIVASVVVDRYLKGTGPDKIEVGSSGAGSSCQHFYDSHVGTDFILLMSKSEHGYWTGECFGNIPLTEQRAAQADTFIAEISALASSLPTSGGPPPESEPSAVPLSAIVAAGVTLVVSGGALALYARRKA